MNPNPDNYGTPEACRRLQAVGIVLETEKVWALNEWPTTKLGLTSYREGWKLIDRPMIGYKEQISAPCFTEVWRELPEELESYGRLCTLQTSKIRQYTGDVVTSVQYIYDNEEFGELVQHFNANVNPTDAIIDLLIWAREEIKWKRNRGDREK